jgi:hypothetical protein
VKAVLQEAVGLASALNDSPKLRALFVECAKATGSRVLTLGSYCATRFASAVRVGLTVLKCKPVLFAVATHSDFDAQVGGTATGRKFYDTVTDLHFFKRLECVMQLLKPVLLNIHQLEQDKPLLGQVYLVWEALEGFAIEWAAAVEASPVKELAELAEGVADLFQRRKEAHREPWTFVAFALDPLNWELDADEGNYCPAVMGPLASEGAKQVLERYFGGPEHSEAAMEEYARFLTEGIPPHLTIHVQGLHASRSMKVIKGVARRVVANAAARRRLWRQHLSTAFPLLSQVAIRTLSMHATSCASERNWCIWGQVYTKLRNRLALSRAEMVVFVRNNLQTLRKERASFASDSRDAEVMLAMFEGLETQADSEETLDNDAELLGMT